MKHLSVAWKLKEIADLLELLGESSFKIKAYREAAGNLEVLSEDLEKIWREGRLTEIQGIGKSIAGRIDEILQTGDTEYLKELKKQIPEGLGDLLDIPGVGPKLARRIRVKLRITSVTELEAALQAGKIREVPGLDIRTELQLLRAVKEMRAGLGELLLGVALPYGQELVARLKRISGVKNVVITGELRRSKEVVPSLALLVATDEPTGLLEAFIKLPECQEVLERRTDRVVVKTVLEIKVELFVTSLENFPLKLLFTTGPESHLAMLTQQARKLGLVLSDDLLVDKDGQRVFPHDESEVYSHLDLNPIIPELRGDVMAFQVAKEGKLPYFLSLDQIKGDLHTHTRWSDGVNTLEEMVSAAQKLGYQYLAVTDHSCSLKVGKGMKLEVLQEQLKAIDELNARLKDFQLLKGAEVDILSGGSLDYPDEVLAKLDLVIASIHTGFSGSEEELTGRIISAMENPYVHIIGHPTGRLLKRRAPYQVNLDRIIKAAKDTGTVLEINATPDRLDLAANYVKMCKDLGVKLAINSDAHSVKQMANMEYGVKIARSGWLEELDVINTYSLSELKAFLKIG